MRPTDAMKRHSAGLRAKTDDSPLQRSLSISSATPAASFRLFGRISGGYYSNFIHHLGLHVALTFVHCFIEDISEWYLTTFLE